MCRGTPIQPSICSLWKQFDPRVSGYVPWFAYLPFWLAIFLHTFVDNLNMRDRPGDDLPDLVKLCFGDDSPETGKGMSIQCVTSFST